MCKDPKMIKLIAVKMGRMVYKELKVTCLQHSNSKFKDKSVNAVVGFSWTDTLGDIKRTAPLLSTMLQNFVGAGSSKLNHAEMKRKEISVVLSAGILLQSCSERANLVKRYISLLLYASHCPKQVELFFYYNYHSSTLFNILVIHKATGNWIKCVSQNHY